MKKCTKYNQHVQLIQKWLLHDINSDVSFGHTWIFLPTKCCFDVTQTINVIGIMSIYLQVHVHKEYISWKDWVNLRIYLNSSILLLVALPITEGNEPSRRSMHWSSWRWYYNRKIDIQSRTFGCTNMFSCS